MITRELLKKEIDDVKDEYLVALHRIFNTFEISKETGEFESAWEKTRNKGEYWHNFIEKWADCLSNNPISQNKGMGEPVY